jgi:hypothetical protein
MGTCRAISSGENSEACAQASAGGGDEERLEGAAAGCVPHVAAPEVARREHGSPNSARVKDGPASVVRKFDLGAYHNGFTLDFTCTGKPTDNGFTAAFKGRLHAECVNFHRFARLAGARKTLGN